MEKLDRKSSAWLYVVVLCCSLFFFILGLLVGRGQLGGVREVGEADVTTARPAPAEPPQTLAASTGPGEEQSGARPEPAAGVGEEPSEGPSQRPGASRRTPELLIDRPEVTSQPVRSQREIPAVSGQRVFTVQVGAFRTRSEADQVVLRLSAKGYEATIVGPDSMNAFYRICVGKSELREGVSELESRLKADGFSTYVRALNAELLSP